MDYWLIGIARGKQGRIDALDVVEVVRVVARSARGLLDVLGQRLTKLAFWLAQWRSVLVERPPQSSHDLLLHLRRELGRETVCHEQPQQRSPVPGPRLPRRGASTPGPDRATGRSGRRPRAIPAARHGRAAPRPLLAGLRRSARDPRAAAGALRSRALVQQMQAGPPRWLFGLPVRGALEPARARDARRHRDASPPRRPPSAGRDRRSSRRPPPRPTTPVVRPRAAQRCTPAGATARPAPAPRRADRSRLLILRPSEASDVLQRGRAHPLVGIVYGQRPDAAALAGAGEDHDQMTANTRVRLFDDGAAQIARRSPRGAAAPSAHAAQTRSGRLSFDEQRLQDASGSRRRRR